LRLSLSRMLGRIMDRATELGKHLEWLKASIEVAEPNAVAGLIRERRATLSELASLPSSLEGSKADDLRARREARKRRTNNSSGATRRAQPRRSNGSHRAG